MPPPPHLKPGVNLYNQHGSASKANSGAVSFDKIKCGICKLTRPVSEYAKRQQQKHADSIYNPYAPGGRSTKAYATCKECTAKQVTQLHCMICNNTMALKYFNKTQRQDPDHARCRQCVQVNEDRGKADPTQVDSEDYDDSSDSDGGDIDDNEDEEKYLPSPPKKPSAEMVSDSADSDDQIDDSDPDEKKASKKLPPHMKPVKKSVAATPVVPSRSTRTPIGATPIRAKAASRATSTAPTGTATPLSYASMAGTPNSKNPDNSGSSAKTSSRATSTAPTGTATPLSYASMAVTPNPKDPDNAGSDDPWHVVSRAKKGNAFSSRGSPWSGAQTPSISAKVKKGGWAKPEKLKKDQNPPFFGGSQTSSPGIQTPIISPAYLPTGGQPSMVNKKLRSKKALQPDSDDEYDI